jgi:hypothetical protein
MDLNVFNSTGFSMRRETIAFGRDSFGAILKCSYSATTGGGMPASHPLSQINR